MLLAVHVLIAAHATHFLIRGRTLSPVEPSESMYTLELGWVNAGFIFFAVALLATLVFGRFFCGWGCHLVALQDLCGWIMKRLGVRPRPFRSRLLLFAPLVVALYMFVWPTARRLAQASLGRPDTGFPGFSNHLMTDSFWATFPGPLFTVLTLLVCGFLAVYFLGAKGFCSYGCPYGGFFGAIDSLSPGRILVSDDCEQCGHCTATCTSNVRVHEEVRLYGMVVDPGCMKCTDCITVCPKNALRYGFGRPPLFKGAAQGTPAKKFDLGWVEELSLVAIAFASWWAFRGLYDGVPLLMAVGLAGITAFVALQLWRLPRRKTVRVQNLNLKLGGEWRPVGWMFAGAALLWLLFAAHSGFVQWHRAWGAHHLERTEAARADVLAGLHGRRSYTDAHHRSAERSLRHFATADRWGMVDVVEIKLGLAWGHLLNNAPGPAEYEMRRAIAVAPERPDLRRELIALFVARGRRDEAIDEIRALIDLGDPAARDHADLGRLLAETDEPEAAVEQYRAALALGIDSFEVYYTLGGLLRRLERPAEALEPLQSALRANPQDRDVHVELALAHLAAGGAGPRAVELLRRAIELDPEHPESRLHLPGLIRQIEQQSASP